MRDGSAGRGYKSFACDVRLEQPYRLQDLVEDPTDATEVNVGDLTLTVLENDAG